MVQHLQIPIAINTLTSTSFVNFIASLPAEKEETLQQLDAILKNFDIIQEKSLEYWRHQIRNV